MHPHRSLQDVLRCNLCETPIPTMYCDICHTLLCKTCVGSHLLEVLTEHKVVPFNKRRSTPMCHQHSPKICELFCEQCDIIICATCVSSGDHEQHKKVDIGEKINSMKEDFKKDVQELEELILPKYEAVVSKIPDKKAAFETNSQTLKMDIVKKGEEWHKEIDNIINKLKSDIEEIDSRQKTILNKQEDEYAHIISEIKRNIFRLKCNLNTNDFHCLYAYKSRNGEFRRRLSPKFAVSLPTFITHQINKEQIKQQFGFLSALAIKED